MTVGCKCIEQLTFNFRKSLIENQINHILQLGNLYKIFRKLCHNQEAARANLFYNFVQIRKKYYRNAESGECPSPCLARKHFHWSKLGSLSAFSLFTFYVAQKRKCCRLLVLCYSLVFAPMDGPDWKNIC